MLEDENGGWFRLKLKCEVYGLVIVGAIMPGRLPIQSHLDEFVANARAYGVESPRTPSSPTPFTLLIQELSSLGLMPC